jgi:hypothetical protein
LFGTRVEATRTPTCKSFCFFFQKEALSYNASGDVPGMRAVRAGLPGAGDDAAKTASVNNRIFCDRLEVFLPATTTGRRGDGGDDKKPRHGHGTSD